MRKILVAALACMPLLARAQTPPQYCVPASQAEEISIFLLGATAMQKHFAEAGNSPDQQAGNLAAAAAMQKRMADAATGPQRQQDAVAAAVARQKADDEVTLKNAVEAAVAKQKAMAPVIVPMDPNRPPVQIVP